MNTGYIALLLITAALCETIVDILKSRFPEGKLSFGQGKEKSPKKKSKAEDLKSNLKRNGTVWPIIGLIIGIMLSFAFQCSIVNAIPALLGLGHLAWPVDRIQAGLLIGGGASTIYDFMDTKRRAMTAADKLAEKEHQV